MLGGARDAAGARNRDDPDPQQVGVSDDSAAVDDDGMTTEQNKAIVHDFIDSLFTKGDLSAVDEYLDERFVNHDPPVGLPGDREGMRTAGQMFREAFPDWHSDLELLVAEGDIVVERFTASGTHRRELMGAAPSGNTVNLAGINIFRVRDGRIVERWGRLDELGLLRQLGLAG
jgi:predicted ester cyclase